jgi:DNA-binding NtrC family response regulator
MSAGAILCVDDEAIILVALKQELRRAFGGEFIYEASMDPAQALDTIDELIADGVRVILIISDWLMPKLKGDEFLALAKGKHPEIRAIMITGQADEAVIASSLGSGLVRAVLRKPWDSRELVRTVRECCLSGERG